MIVNTGKTKLLDIKTGGMTNYKWGLFTSNTTITSATILSNLTEAAWGGYARQTAGAWGASTIVSGKAQSSPNANPNFANSSGSSQTFFGWFLTDSAGTTLIAATNIGSTSVPDGQSYQLAPAITDDD